MVMAEAESIVDVEQTMEESAVDIEQIKSDLILQCPPEQFTEVFNGKN